MIKEIYSIKPQAKADSALLDNEIDLKLSQLRALTGILSRVGESGCDESEEYGKIFWFIEDTLDQIGIVREALRSPRLVSDRKEAANG